jgi:hypothetical protein
MIGWPSRSLYCYAKCGIGKTDTARASATCSRGCRHFLFRRQALRNQIKDGCIAPRDLLGEPHDDRAAPRIIAFLKCNTHKRAGRDEAVRNHIKHDRRKQIRVTILDVCCEDLDTVDRTNITRATAGGDAPGRTRCAAQPAAPTD